MSSIKQTITYIIKEVKNLFKLFFNLLSIKSFTTKNYNVPKALYSKRWEIGKSYDQKNTYGSILENFYYPHIFI
jgi:hypothetical protein